MYACVSALCVSLLCMCMCLCQCGVSFPGSSLAGSCAPATSACPSPHPSTAPLPAASPSRLLWQMFGCAMATPEQDVPLDRSRDKPALPGCPRCFPPQRLSGKNCWGPGRGQMVFVWERGRASVLLRVSGSGGGGCTCTSQLSPCQSHAKEAGWEEELFNVFPSDCSLRDLLCARTCAKYFI